MKKQNSKSKVTKRKLSKCKEVCRTYNDIQYAYCDYLQADSSIVEFQCNVILTDFSIEGAYSTDFVCTKANGDMMVRECVSRDKEDVRMSILKRVISLLLCIVMLTSVLASCDTDDSHNHETSESTTEQPQGTIQEKTGA